MSDGGDSVFSDDCIDDCLEACCCDCFWGPICFRILCALVIVTVLAAVVTLLIFAFVPSPVRVSVEDAAFSRLGLAVENATATALAYDISLAVAVHNDNWLMRAVHTAPLDAELLFAGARFARVRLAAAGAVVRPGRMEVYHATAAADNTSVALGNAGVGEFLRESAAGVFRMEVKVVGQVRYRPHHKLHMLDAICRLELALSTATSPAMFKKVKCDVQKGH
uniref:Late embryogenesis abundant protein LEA-2 subgroup domain-containing protein n=1 Tax=Aegilops tauschii subsp. strangulata TaxID=200361 RepID=A0A453N1Q9_AEGTS